MQTEPIYGFDDISTLKDGTNAEIIHGRLVYPDISDVLHNDVCRALYNIILKQMASPKIKGTVYISPFAVLLDNSSTDYIKPDISIVLNPDIVQDNKCFGTPELIIEVSSLSTRHMDYYTKFNAYRSAGVREYWIVDLERRIVTVHFFDDEKSPYFFTFRNKVKVNIYNGVYVDLKEIKEMQKV